MQENEDKESRKEPIEMTSEELLDYAIHPEVAERVKDLARECDESEDSED